MTHTIIHAMAAVASGSLTLMVSADIFCSAGTTAIPDGSAGVSRSVAVQAEPGSVVSSLRVSVEITHPWVGDLRLVLRHPSGAEVVLLDRPGLSSGGGTGLGFPGPWGCGGDNLSVTFDDAALIPAESACETVGVAIVGSKRPLDSLTPFVGLPAAGTWTLEASDLIAIDAGTLGQVCLDITLSQPSQCPSDLDGNAAVDAADLAILLGAWGSCRGCPSDFNADGIIDGADLATLLGAWGVCNGS